MSSSCKGQGIDYTRSSGEVLRYFSKSECDRVGGRWMGALDNGRGECVSNNGSPNYSILCIGADPGKLAPDIEGVSPGGPLDGLFSFFGGSTESNYSNLLLPALGVGALVYLLRWRS